MTQEKANKTDMRKYREFSSYYIDSNFYQMFIDEEITEEYAIKSAAIEFQFSVDGFSNAKIVEDLINDFYKS